MFCHSREKVIFSDGFNRCFKPLNHSRFPGFQLLKGLGSQNVPRLLDFQVPRNTQDRGNGLPNLADARAVASIFFSKDISFSAGCHV